MTALSFVRFLTAIVMIPYFLFNYVFNNYAYPAVSTEGAYVFCYFVGNEVDEQTLHFAVSTDGYNFKALNGNKTVIENLGNNVHSRRICVNAKRENNLGLCIVTKNNAVESNNVANAATTYSNGGMCGC